MFFCNCLNIVGELNGQKKDEKSKLKINNVQSCTTNSLYYELLDFFKLALGFTCDDMKITVQHPILVNKIKMDKWTVGKCLNCDCNVYAVPEDNNNNNEILVNENLMRGKDVLLGMMRSENYSMPFKIILKQIDLLPNTIKSTINDDVHVRNLFAQLQDFITHETSETEAEIRKLQNRMNQRRQQAEKEFQLIMSLVSSIESSSSRNNFSTHESTNDHIQSLYSTPPVTPESAQLMTIDQLPSHPIIKHVDHNHREGISKHNNAILMQQKVTRTIDFDDDDIFELDGMHKDESVEENDRYHKYSDTGSGEGSDVDEIISEKRPYRGRSGSLAIARSAPIKMPQFLNHGNSHLEEKNTNTDHDIASSIKLLAKSIHADSIFGELPNSRPIFKYNTDF